MKKNNFNCNCNGDSVEFEAYYDLFMSREYFNDNFVIDYQTSRYVETMFFIAGEWKKEDFIITLLEHDNNRMNALKYGCMNEDYYAEYSTIDVINEAFADYKTYYDLLRAYDEAGIEYEINFKIITTRGYSQGDSIDVYILNDLNGWTITEDKLREYIYQLCWDAPVYVRLEINGDEVEIMDAFDDNYFYWDDGASDKIGDYLKRMDYSDAVINEVLSVVPDSIDYI